MVGGVGGGLSGGVGSCVVSSLIEGWADDGCTLFAEVLQSIEGCVVEDIGGCIGACWGSTCHEVCIFVGIGWGSGCE